MMVIACQDFGSSLNGINEAKKQKKIDKTRHGRRHLMRDICLHTEVEAEEEEVVIINFKTFQLQIFTD